MAQDIPHNINPHIAAQAQRAPTSRGPDVTGLAFVTPRAHDASSNSNANASSNESGSGYSPEFLQVLEQARTALHTAQTTADPKNWQTACHFAGRLLTHKQFPQDSHWFCDPVWVPFARLILVVISLPQTADATYNLVSSKIKNCLQCTRKYHEEKEFISLSLRKDLGIPSNRVELVLSDIRKRDIHRLSKTLSQIVEKNRNRIMTTDIMAELSHEETISVYECFYLAAEYNGLGASYVVSQAVSALLSICKSELFPWSTFVSTTISNSTASSSLITDVDIDASIPGVYALYLSTASGVPSQDCDHLHEWIYDNIFPKLPWSTRTNKSASGEPTIRTPLSISDNNGPTMYSTLRAIIWTNLADVLKEPSARQCISLAQIMQVLDSSSIRQLLLHSDERTEVCPALNESCDIVASLISTLKSIVSHKKVVQFPGYDPADYRLQVAHALLLLLGTFPVDLLVSGYFKAASSTETNSNSRSIPEFITNAMSSLDIWMFPHFKRLGKSEGILSYIWSFDSVMEFFFKLVENDSSEVTIECLKASETLISTAITNSNDGNTSYACEMGHYDVFLSLALKLVKRYTKVAIYADTTTAQGSSSSIPVIKTSYADAVSSIFRAASLDACIVPRCFNVARPDDRLQLLSDALSVLDHAVQFEMIRDVQIVLRSRQLNGNEPIPKELYNKSTFWKSALFTCCKKYLPQAIASVIMASNLGVLLSYHAKSSAAPSTPSIIHLIASLKRCSEISEIDAKDMFRRHAKKLMRNAILLTFISNKDVSQLADDLLIQAFEPTAIGRIEGIQAMLAYNPTLVLGAVVDALHLVIDYKEFSPCTGVVKVVQDYLDAMYDSGAGVNTESLINRLTKGPDNELLQFWKSVWKFLKFSLDNIKEWSKFYPSAVMLEFVKDQMHFGHGLLENFRLFESDLAACMPPNETRCGELLAQPVIYCIEPMCVLLKLRDLKLIEASLTNILAILKLMKSFKVATPNTLITMFCNYSNQSIKNNLTMEQCRTLLEAIGTLSTDKIDSLVEQGHQRRRSPSASQTAQTQQSTPHSGTLKTANQSPSMQLTYSSIPTPASNIKQLANKGQMVQRTLRDFDIIKHLGPSDQHSQFEESTPAQMSQMERLRQNLLTSKLNPNTKKMPAHAAPPKEIHPPRPPGFNSKKTDPASSSNDIQIVNGTSGAKRPRLSSTDLMSDCSDSDDDDDDDDGLFKKRKVTSSAILITTESQASSNKKSSSTQKEIDEKNMHARMNIDISPFHASVLAWNYHHADAYPPDHVKKAYRSVPDTFKSYKEYQEVFEPLLLLECWQGILGSKEGADSNKRRPFTVDVGRRVRCDDFYDIYATMSTNEFNREKITDSDLILLTCYGSERLPAAYPDPAIPNCLAKVTRVSKSKTATGCTDINLRIHNSIGPVLTKLFGGSICHAIRVMSLATVEREYTSLRALEYYELKKQILNAEPALPFNNAQLDLKQVQQRFDASEAQARAVGNSVDVNGFSLILGPPGTGKTKTILAILGLALTTKNRKKILVCAPSNAAVDELVIRIKRGLKSNTGAYFNPKLIRVGRSEAVHEQVQDVTLEEIVDRECSSLNSKTANGASSAGSGNAFEEQQKLSRILSELKDKRTSNGDELPADSRAKLEDQIRDTIQALKEIRHKVNIEREEQMKERRNQDVTRRQVQEKVLRDADIVCATLSGASHSVLSTLKMTFGMVVIDEAAQSIELSSLIPLKYGCRSCVLVGDPKQLPPTVLSQEASKLKYEKSLFVRMFNNHKDRISLLNIQFRMHPDIARFPSKAFYDGKLFTSPLVLNSTSRPWHNYLEYAPYRFFDSVSRDRSSARSFENIQEAEIILNIYEKLLEVTHVKLAPGSVGIISPYKMQVVLIRKLFEKHFGSAILKDIEFNTVDAYQGQEKDIIFFSCVRADTTKGIGFLNDQRRLNVAITRAKCSLWIVGHGQHLRDSSPIWNDLVSDAERRNMVSKAHKGFLNSDQRAYAPVDRTIEVARPDTADATLIYDIPLKPDLSYNVLDESDYPSINRDGHHFITVTERVSSSSSSSLSVKTNGTSGSNGRTDERGYTAIPNYNPSKPPSRPQPKSQAKGLAKGPVRSTNENMYPEPKQQGQGQGQRPVPTKSDKIRPPASSHSRKKAPTLFNPRFSKTRKQ